MHASSHVHAFNALSGTCIVGAAGGHIHIHALHVHMHCGCCRWAYTHACPTCTYALWVLQVEAEALHRRAKLAPRTHHTAAALKRTAAASIAPAVGGLPGRVQGTGRGGRKGGGGAAGGGAAGGAARAEGEGGGPNAPPATGTGYRVQALVEHGVVLQGVLQLAFCKSASHQQPSLLWSKQWVVLSGCTLYVYTTPQQRSTTGIIALSTDSRLTMSAQRHGQAAAVAPFHLKYCEALLGQVSK